MTRAQTINERSINPALLLLLAAGWSSAAP